MNFRTYLRYDGLTCVIVGASLYTLGTVQGHQGHLDALIGGLVTLVMTAAFMRVRRGVALRDLGGWFTSEALAARPGAPAGSPAPRSNLALRVPLAILVLAASTLALSHLTGHWMTYMDLAVWIVATGLIKIGPAVAAVMAHETASRSTLQVVARPLRGPVSLVWVPQSHPLRHHQPRPSGSS